MASGLSGTGLARRLRALRARRQAGKDLRRRKRILRGSLKSAERRRILAKTGGRCHVCGGKIKGEPWQADHMLAFSGGGVHAEANYLPAHSLCNNYRWDYLPDEFRYILKLGVWARTQVERETPLGRDVARRFAEYERRRVRRRVESV